LGFAAAVAARADCIQQQLLLTWQQQQQSHLQASVLAAAALSCDTGAAASHIWCQPAAPGDLPPCPPPLSPAAVLADCVGSDLSVVEAAGSRGGMLPDHLGAPELEVLLASARRGAALPSSIRGWAASRSFTQLQFCTAACHPRHIRI
jgi:hypothetical protein